MARTRGKREARGASHLGRRGLSLLLAMIMCVSLVQISVFAADKGSDQQIKPTDTYLTYDDATGEADGNASDSPEKMTADGVKLSKSITGTDTENVFQIDLSVTTSEKLQEYESVTGANVVLVFDVSTSMDYTTDGKEPGKSGWSLSKTRWTALKKATDDFIDKFLTADNTDNQLSIVVYGGSNVVHQGDADHAVLLDWTTDAAAAKQSYQKYDVVCQDYVNAKDVSQKTSLRRAKFGDTGMDYGATNCQAGFRAADQQLTKLAASNNAAYTNNTNYVVYMSDGDANVYYGNDDTSVTTTGGKPMTAHLYYPDGQVRKNWNIKEWDARSTANSITGAQGQAALLKTNHDGVTLYTIGFGVNGTTAARVLKPADGIGATDGYNTSVDEYFDAADAEKLSVQFGHIADRIQVATEAWTVTDPMSQYMDKGSVELLSSAACFGYDRTTGQITWNLKADTAYTTEVVGDTTYYTYTRSYKVKLNNWSDEVLSGAFVPTNDATELVYALHDSSTGELDTQVRKAYFNVPQVKGFCVDALSFTKVTPKKTPLAGAQFTITNAAGTWTDSATSNEGGVVTFTKPIPSGDTYTLKETIVPDGYTAVADQTFTVSYGEGGPTIENGKIVDPVEQRSTDVTFTKTWLVPAGTAIPDFITVTLYQNGKVYEGAYVDADGNTQVTRFENLNIYKDTCEVNDNGVWSYTFKNLPEVDDMGDPYVYTVTEAARDDYKVDGNGTLALTNTASGKVNILVEKNWILPDTMTTTGTKVTVNLLANGQIVDSQEITGSGTAMFLNKDKYDSNGQSIAYAVEEATGNYQQVLLRKTEEAGPTTMWEIVNTVAQEYDVTVSGTKIWKDGEDTTARSGIQVQLYADGVAVDGQIADVTEDGGWTYRFTDLPRYHFVKDDAGTVAGVQEIVYTVKEVEAPDGYVSSSVGTDVINTRTGTVNFTVSKEWTDLAGADHGAVVAILYANGHPVAESEAFTDTYTFADLAKYDADGEAIRYDVIERPVDGYTASYSDVTTDASGDYQQTITNRRDDADDTITVTVTKVWKQPGDVADQTATFQLYADGEKVEGKILQITGNGVATFTNLPRYAEVVDTETGETDLAAIDYDVEEIDIPKGYIKTVDEELTPDSSGNFTCNFVNTITGKTAVSVEKQWVKPATVATPDITVNVQRYNLDTQAWETYDAIELKDGATSGKLTDLDAYDADGRRLTYRVEELAVAGYSSAVTGGLQADGTYAYQIVNTINPANTTLKVSKTWIDGDTPAADRPDVTVWVLQNTMDYASVNFSCLGGQVVATDGSGNALTVTVSEDGNTYTADVEVPAFSADRTLQYSYTVKEYDVPAGYRATVADNTVTNLRVGTIDIDLTKYWTDPGDMDRPDITLVLTGSDGSTRNVLVSDDNQTVTATLDGEALKVAVSGSAWTITVAGLPEFDARGAKITYSLSETPVSGYDTVAVEGQPFAVRNIIKQESVGTPVTATKVWANMDADGVYKPEYPASITVALFQDGVMVEGSKQTVNRTEGNTYPINGYEGLDKYASDGHRYVYEIAELRADGSRVKDGETISFGENNDYTVTYDNGVITNTFKVPAKYMYVVTTNYIHYSYDGTVVSSYSEQTGIMTETERKTVTANPADYQVCSKDGLTYQLDESKDNVLSVDLIRENHLYELLLNYVLTDTRPVTPPDPGPGGDDTVSVTVRKVWKGDKEENRPDSVTVQLLRNGEAYESKSFTTTRTLSASNNWRTSWVSLSDSYSWSVEEVDVPDGYTADVTRSGSVWTITNTLTGSTPVNPDKPVNPDQPVNPTDPANPVNPSDPGNGGTGTTNPGTNPGKTDGEKGTPAKTGDAMGLWVMTAAASGMGLVWITLSGRKRKTEE